MYYFSPWPCELHFFFSIDHIILCNTEIIGIINFERHFSKFYRRHYELVSKFNVGLKTLLHQGLSEPEFYSDLVNKFKNIVCRVDFSDQFRKIIVRYKRIGHNINIMQQSACLVFNPIMVNNFTSFFNCTPVGRASDSMMAPTGLGRSFFVCCLAHRGSAVGFRV